MSDEKQTQTTLPGMKNGYWYLFTHTIVRHCFILLIIFPRWGRLFVLANYFVKFSKLKFNDIFTCVRWRMGSGSLPQRGRWQPQADGWGEQINAVYYSVRFSKLRINDIFTCVRWIMDSGRGEHRSSADCQWQPLLSYLTALFSRWLFTRTDYCAAWLCPPHPLLTLEKAFCYCKLFCSVF